MVHFARMMVNGVEEAEPETATRDAEGPKEDARESRERQRVRADREEQLLRREALARCAKVRWEE